MRSGVFTVLILSAVVGCIIAHSSKKCGPHQIFTRCHYTTCVVACNRRGPLSCPAGGTSCRSGCLCRKGFIRLDWRNLRGRCVRPSQCP